MARPPLNDDERLGKQINVPCTDGEKSDYEWARTVAKEKSRAEWVRKTLNAEVARLRKKHGK